MVNQEEVGVGSSGSGAGGGAGCCLVAELDKVIKDKVIFSGEWRGIMDKYKLSNTITIPPSGNGNKKSKKEVRPLRPPLFDGDEDENSQTMSVGGDTDTVDRVDKGSVSVSGLTLSYKATTTTTERKPLEVIEVKQVIQQPSVPDVVVKPKAAAVKVEVKRSVIVDKATLAIEEREAELGKRREAILNEMKSLETVITNDILELETEVNKPNRVESGIGKESVFQKFLGQFDEVLHLTGTAERLAQEQDERLADLWQRQESFAGELEKKMEELGIEEPPKDFDDSYLNLNMPMSINDMIEVCQDGGHPESQIQNLEELKIIFKANNVRPVFVITKANYICDARVRLTPNQTVGARAAGDDPMDALQKALRDLDKQVSKM